MVSRLQEHAWKAAPGERLTFIFKWTSKPDLAAIYAIENRDARILAAQVAYHELKHVLVKELLQHQQLEVQDLPGTAAAIVSAPAEVWRELEPWLDGIRDIDILENREIGIAV